MLTILRNRFGFDHFRPGQKEIIEAVIHGNHVLGILATGSGKTLCYQLASLLLPGITVVISPLIALMEDQWTRFRQSGYKEVGIFHSGLGEERIKSEWKKLESGKIRTLLISPERLTNPAFLKRLSRFSVSLIVVDEAHCVVQWGNDFRPDYLQIASVYQTLGNPPVMALTGTASPAMQEEILNGLSIPNAKKVQLSMNRPNISYAIYRLNHDAEKLDFLLKELPLLKGQGIIYAGTRNQAELLAATLSQQLKANIPAYHGGMSSEDRSIIQNQFIRGEAPILVATSAFGMGIDKEDIRFVIHFHMPSSIEAYLQETGRIGRDQNPGIAILLYAEDDLNLTLRIIDSSIPNLMKIYEMLQYLSCKSGMINLHSTQTEQLPFRLFLYHLQNEGYISTSRQGDELHYEWKMPLKKEQIKHFEQIFESLRKKRREELKAFASIIQTKSCIRRKMNDFFAEERHDYYPFCCSNCGIDPSFYQQSVTLKPIKPIWNWEEELDRLLPVKSLT